MARSSMFSFGLSSSDEDSACQPSAGKALAGASPAAWGEGAHVYRHLTMACAPELPATASKPACTRGCTTRRRRSLQAPMQAAQRVCTSCTLCAWMTLTRPLASCAHFPWAASPRMLRGARLRRQNTSVPCILLYSVHLLQTSWQPRSLSRTGRTRHAAIRCKVVAATCLVPKVAVCLWGACLQYALALSAVWNLRTSVQTQVLRYEQGV